MADAQRTVDLVFNAVDKTGPAVQSALRNTRGLATDIQSATQPFADVTAAALKYEAALLATGAAITAFSIKAAGDFDGAFREIATLIDQPIDSLGNFRQEILDYAETSTSSLESVTSSVYNAISAGVDYTDSLAAVNAAEQLSVAGKGELDDTLKLLVSSLNAYGLGMDEAERFSDALFTTVKVGQTTLPELTANLQQVTGTAAAVGVPFEEVLAALAALTSAGTPTAQAVTQISSVLSAFLKPSAEAARVAQELGIEFSAQALKANGLEATLQAVAQATGGNEEIMAKLFPRVESLRAVFPLTGQAAEKFADNLDAIQGSAGATEEAYEKLAATLNNQAGRIASAFEVLLVSIGDPLLDDFGSVADAIRAIFSALTDSFQEGELRAITAFIESEFASLAEVLQGVAQALPAALEQADLSGFTDGLEAVRDAVQSLFGDLDLTDAEDLAKALEFVGDAFNGLSQFSAGAIESFGPLFRLFADLAQKASESAGSLDAVGQAFGIASQVNAFAGALAGVVPWMEAIVGLLIANQGVSLLSGLTQLGKTLGGAGGVVSQLTALAGAGAAGYGLGKLADEVTELATGKGLSERLADWLVSFTDINEQAERLTETTRPSAEAAAQAIREADQAMRTYSGNIEEAVDFWGEYGSETGQVVGTLYDLSRAADDAGAKTRALGADGQALDGFFSVVSSGAEKTEKALSDLSGISDELKVDLALASIASQTDIAVAAIEASASKVEAAFGSIDNTVSETGTNIRALYGLLTDENLSKFDKIDVKKSIDEQEKLQKEALQLQNRLAREQIEEVRARMAALQRGDALIKVEGGSLQPHLEAFMWELFEAIQIRVNAQGQQLLLGIGG